MAGSRLVYGRLVGVHIIVPVGPFPDIRLGKFPVLRLHLDALQKTLFLFFSGKVQEYLHHAAAVFIQVFLKMADLPVAFFEKVRVLQHACGHFVVFLQRMHLYHQHILVIRAVEQRHLAPGRQRLHGTPKIIVRQLLAGWLFKAVHVYSLGIHAAHHMLDSAVLACGIHSLQNDEHGLPSIRIQLVLQRLDAPQIFFSAPEDILLVHTVFFRAGIHTAQFQLFFTVKTVILKAHLFQLPAFFVLRTRAAAQAAGLRLL